MYVGELGNILLMVDRTSESMLLFAYDRHIIIRAQASKQFVTF